MNYYGDYHVHTRFCDGKDSPADMAKAACELGLSCLGFSGHAHTAFDESWCMSREGTRAYINAVEALKKEYRGKMDILLGTELDYFSDVPSRGYDFTIGSVHYLKAGEAFLPVDESAEALSCAADKYFGGSFLKLAESYFALVEDIIRKTGCTVVGHFDLVTKFNEGQKMFPETGEYLDMAFAAVDSLCAQEAVFEINTGAMSRGYRSAPYPSLDILRRINEKGGRLILSSDCHDKKSLCYGFELASELSKSAGFESRCVLTPQGIKEIALD